MKAQHSLLSIAGAMVAATLGADAPRAEEASAMLSPRALQEIAQVEAEIDRIEAQTIGRLAAPPDVDSGAERLNGVLKPCVLIREIRVIRG